MAELNQARHEITDDYGKFVMNPFNHRANTENGSSRDAKSWLFITGRKKGRKNVVFKQADIDKSQTLASWITKADFILCTYYTIKPNMLQ